VERILVVFLNSLAGALVSKTLLLFAKQNSSLIGLFISWLLASFLALCTPYPFLGALVFGFFFMRATSVGKIWPYGILAVFLFWGLQHWLDGVMPGFLHSSLQYLGPKWHSFASYMVKLCSVTSGRVG
jgi:Na+/proline symporter